MSGSATICIRPPRGVGGSTVVRNYPTPEAGAKAAQTPKCGAKCAGAHLLLIYDRQGQPRVAKLPKPPPPPLSVELEQLYPHPPTTPLPARWPAPPELNEPLIPTVTTSPLREHEDRAASNTPVVPAVVPPVPPLPGQNGVAGVVGTPQHPPRCGAEGCDRKIAARGLCMKHYDQKRHAGLMEPRTLTVADRFWSRVDKRGACWLWLGSTTQGYARLSVGHRGVPAHRIGWELTRGPIPDGMELGHRGDCPRLCVHPHNWALATHEENAAYAAAHPKPNDGRKRRRPDRLCTVDGCTRKHLARGLCRCHQSWNTLRATTVRW